ncbi:hypothetical protein AJ79_06638 [Helicocarpus griseus UAMH5409]|uniref:Zinc finger PHD-type domain-containing protein n=1 Tax=Helicocarpus griseus UAMH5409 TaxID=1447875 RepID=A0A2B7X373_9EURO|nr:hypothetical protein AJ79_06638 [Helicocarpus griseus UAMH5409]
MESDNSQRKSKKRRNLSSSSCRQTESRKTPCTSKTVSTGMSALAPMWVAKDDCRRPRLVSENVPGTRHWRIGDPNMDTCYVCRLKNNLFGCRTCMRSCHAICLDPPLKDSDVPSPFHCPVCVERKWHVDPPSYIRPLSPMSSSNTREMSPGTSHEAVNATKHYSASSERYTVARESGVTPTTTMPLSSSGVDSMKSFGISHETASSISYRHDTCHSSRLLERKGAECSTPSTSAGAPRRSRYQTVSNEVDDALSTIYRELEMGVELQAQMRDLQARVSFLEQELSIANGKVALSRQEVAAEYAPEVKCLQNQLCMEKDENRRLAEENKRLKAQMEELKGAGCSQELEEWKRRLRDFVNSKA